jgi:hypothetical protein
MADLTTGCKICFTEPVFSGNYRNATYLGDRTITGTITKESYGAKSGQHTFTIQIEDVTGEQADVVREKGTIRRKGRNVYRDCETLSTPDNYETLRQDKHQRGAIARDRRFKNARF